MMVLVAILIAALFGGWLSRMCGGAPPKLPFGLDQWLYALPFLALFIPATLSLLSVKPGKRRFGHEFFWTLAYFGAFAGKRTGHGGGMDLGRSTAPRKDERLEFIIKPLKGRISDYWYDAALLAVTGLCVTLIAGILVAAFFAPLPGLVIAVSGLMKAPAYMIGWAIYPDGSGKGLPHLNEATAVGEFLTGFFGYGGIALAVAMILSP